MSALSIDSSSGISIEPRKFWEQHVNQFQDSGLSKAQYCREHQLTYHQFIYWHPQFDQKSVKPDDGKVRAKLLPVELTPAPIMTELQIALPTGVTISGITEHNATVAVGLIARL